MSRRSTSFILGYHGCDQEIGEQALAGELDLLKSDTAYDWLGPGIYFWEADPQRALEWAEERASRKKIKNAFAIGAVIDLRNCLDLTQRENLDLLSVAYQGLSQSFAKARVTLPENRDPPKQNLGDKLLRNLDCAVIKYLHQTIEEAAPETDGSEHFDTVRGLFVEGEPVYPGARFYQRTHTQISVLSPECIVGLFRV